MDELVSVNTDSEKGIQQQILGSQDIELAEVSLDVNEIKSDQHTKAKRVIHFSDGTVEEFSDDEENPHKQSEYTKPATWTSYIIESLDNMGEKLAWFFGITSPKYQYAIDEYWRRKKEEEEDREFEVREMDAKFERRGRRNVGMEKEDGVPVVTVQGRDSKKLFVDDEKIKVTCKQPSSCSAPTKVLMKSGLVNEGFDDSLKY